MPVAKDADGNVTEKTLEGEYHYWDYGTRNGVSEIQVFRNFENGLETGGDEGYVRRLAGNNYCE